MRAAHPRGMGRLLPLLLVMSLGGCWWHRYPVEREERHGEREQGHHEEHHEEHEDRR
jgi:hypothetical protein